MKLHELINWAAVEKRLVGLYTREASHGGGPIPYDPLSLLNLTLLGQWHHLSDAQLEQALKVRLDFWCSAALTYTRRCRIARRSAGSVTDW